ncbi:hypothetical protein RQP46_003569 [Phenoliferia psychrophenolica]
MQTLKLPLCPRHFSLAIGAIDHSHKIVKWIFQLVGVMISAALLTVTNERGEIRSIYFVPTQAHSAFVSALLALRKSLTIFGHQQPLVFYTDTVGGDGAFLRECFPSLTLGVKPPSKWGDLVAFRLDPASPPIIVSSYTEAEATLDFVLEQVPEEAETQTMVIGFDAEWSVSLVYGGHGGIVSSKRGDGVAVIQNAWERNNYIFQLGKIRRTSKKLPPSLLRLLKNPRVLKAGVGVQADLTLVLKDLGRPSSDAQGAVELAKMAVDQGLLDKSASTLQYLTAVVLSRYLDKDEGVRVSEEWDADVLPATHAVYGAKDA